MIEEAERTIQRTANASEGVCFIFPRRAKESSAVDIVYAELLKAVPGVLGHVR